MPALSYTIIQWTDGAWSFESVDAITGRVVFQSHTWGYPLYGSLLDVEHAIGVCEGARRRTDGADVTTAEVVRKRAATRRRERHQAEQRLEMLLEKHGRRSYTRHPMWGITEAVL